LIRGELLKRRRAGQQEQQRHPKYRNQRNVCSHFAIGSMSDEPHNLPLPGGANKMICMNKKRDFRARKGHHMLRLAQGEDNGGVDAYLAARKTSHRNAIRWKVLQK
jgi:hypothetical protein